MASLAGYHDRWFTVGAGAALLLATLPMTFKLRLPAGESGRGLMGWMNRFPEQVEFFIPLILITVLLERQISSGMVTIAWGIESIVVFLFALWMGKSSFRRAGLGLLLLCVAKIFVVDFWRMDPRDRYLTFIFTGIFQRFLGVGSGNKRVDTKSRFWRNSEKRCGWIFYRN